MRCRIAIDGVIDRAAEVESSTKVNPRRSPAGKVAMLDIERFDVASLATGMTTENKADY